MSASVLRDRGSKPVVGRPLAARSSHGLSNLRRRLIAEPAHGAHRVVHRHDRRLAALVRGDGPNGPPLRRSIEAAAFGMSPGSRRGGLATSGASETALSDATRSRRSAVYPRNWFRHG